MPIPVEFVDPVPANAADPDLDYPANAFAFRYVLPTLLAGPGRNFLEIGTGGGAAIETFTEAGFSMRGFDNNDDAVVASKTSQIMLLRPRILRQPKTNLQQRKLHRLNPLNVRSKPLKRQKQNNQRQKLHRSPLRQ